jgi:outer membrane biogenesis lipoprotein LolB
MKSTFKHALQLGLLAFAALLLSGCSMTFISDYDQATMDEMQLINKKIDRFFLRLSYEDPKERTYRKFKKAYLDIEVELHALKTMQVVRAMNELTVKQVDTALNLWQQERTSHQKNNGISDILIKIHRSQYNRLFMAMIKGEASKPKEPQSK